MVKIHSYVNIYQRVCFINMSIVTMISKPNWLKVTLLITISDSYKTIYNWHNLGHKSASITPTSAPTSPICSPSDADDNRCDQSQKAQERTPWRHGSLADLREVVVVAWCGDISWEVNLNIYRYQISE